MEESLASLLKRCTVLKSGSLVWGKNYQRSLIEHTGLKVGIDIEDNKKRIKNNEIMFVSPNEMERKRASAFSALSVCILMAFCSL